MFIEDERELKPFQSIVAGPAVKIVLPSVLCQRMLTSYQLFVGLYLSSFLLTTTHSENQLQMNKVKRESHTRKQYSFFYPKKGEGNYRQKDMRSKTPAPAPHWSNQRKSGPNKYDSTTAAPDIYDEELAWSKNKQKNTNNDDDDSYNSNNNNKDYNSNSNSNSNSNNNNNQVVYSNPPNMFYHNPGALNNYPINPHPFFNNPAGMIPNFDLLNQGFHSEAMMTNPVLPYHEMIPNQHPMNVFRNPPVVHRVLPSQKVIHLNRGMLAGVPAGPAYNGVVLYHAPSSLLQQNGNYDLGPKTSIHRSSLDDGGCRGSAICMSKREESKLFLKFYLPTIGLSLSALTFLILRQNPSLLNAFGRSQSRSGTLLNDWIEVSTETTPAIRDSLRDSPVSCSNRLEKCSRRFFLPGFFNSSALKDLDLGEDTSLHLGKALLSEQVRCARLLRRCSKPDSKSTNGTEQLHHG